MGERSFLGSWRMVNLWEREMKKGILGTGNNSSISWRQVVFKEWWEVQLPEPRDVDGC